jgi:hypothetical protein
VANRGRAAHKRQSDRGLCHRPAAGTQPRRGTDGTYGFGGTPEYFTDGSLGELGTAACGYAAGPPPPPTPPPPPPTPPPPPPTPPAPTPGEQQPCTTYPEFMAYSQEVTVACCDDASAPCVAGLPTACGEACANANLLPRLPGHDWDARDDRHGSIVVCAPPLSPARATRSSWPTHRK